MTNQVRRCASFLEYWEDQRVTKHHHVQCSRPARHDVSAAFLYPEGALMLCDEHYNRLPHNPIFGFGHIKREEFLTLEVA